jgi:hypothetical protein
MRQGLKSPIKQISEYPVTRPIHLKYFPLILFLFLVIWTVLVTIINFAVYGYENIPLTSTNFNNAERLWYEKFVPSRGSKYVPTTWKCDGSIIKVNEGMQCEFMYAELMKGVATTGLFSYNVLDFYDPNPQNSIDGMTYSNTLIQNCSVPLMTLQFGQVVSPPLLDQVTKHCNYLISSYLCFAIPLLLNILSLERVTWNSTQMALVCNFESCRN